MEQLCFICNNATENISTKEYPCSCGDSVVVYEYVCFNCGSTFEIVNGELVGDPTNSLRDVLEFMGAQFIEDHDVDPEVLKSMLDEIGELAPDFAKECYGESMLSLTHNCLRCNSPSFDDGTGVISCSKCSFEWEVID